MQPQLAIVLKGYPRLSETFVAQEIRELERRGFRAMIVSLRHPYDPATHPIHAEIEAPVHYLPEYAQDAPLRVLRAALALCRRAAFWTTLGRFLRDLRHEPTRNRARRFAQALVMVHELPSSVRHYYTHFIHTPASVSYYASGISGCSWSISAHAKDIWTIGAPELREKLASADFERFGENSEALSQRDGSDPEDPVRLISVGRAVAKKGYDLLLATLAELPAELYWRFTHIGGGELLGQLQQQARDLDIDGRIDWQGAQPQTEVLAAYRAADLFVLPSRIAADGDRDGLPNVLMEAQHDPELRARLAEAGNLRVRETFSMQRGIDQLEILLRASLEPA